jgi:hypothetical protein
MLAKQRGDLLEDVLRASKCLKYDLFFTLTTIVSALRVGRGTAAEPPHLSAKELSAGPREISTRLLRPARASGPFFQCAQTMYLLVSAFVGEGNP